MTTAGKRNEIDDRRCATVATVQDDLPVAYVAGAPVGGYNGLVDWDVSGKLEEAVFGS